MVGTFSKVLQDMDDAVARVGRAVVNTAIGSPQQPGPYYNQQQYQYPGQPHYHPQYVQSGPPPQAMYHQGPPPMQTHHQGPPMPIQHHSYQQQQARPSAMHANSWPHPQPYQHTPQSSQKLPNPIHQYPQPSPQSGSPSVMHSPYEPEPGRTHWGQPLPTDGRPSAVRPTEDPSPAGPPPSYTSIDFGQTADESHNPIPFDNSILPPSSSIVHKPGLPPRRQHAQSISSASPSAPPITSQFEPLPSLSAQYQAASPLLPQHTTPVASLAPGSSLRPSLPPRDARSKSVSMQRPPASMSTPPSITTLPPSLPARSQTTKPRERSSTMSAPSVKMPDMPDMPAIPPMPHMSQTPTLPNIQLDTQTPQLKHSRSHSALSPGDHSTPLLAYPDISNLTIVSPLSPGSRHRANTTFINIDRPVSMLTDEPDFLANYTRASLPGTVSDTRSSPIVELPGAAVVPPKDSPAKNPPKDRHPEVAELPAQVPPLGSNNPFRNNLPIYPSPPNTFELVGSPVSASPIVPLSSKPLLSSPAMHTPATPPIQAEGYENHAVLPVSSDGVVAHEGQDDPQPKPIERKGTIMEEWNYHGGFSLGYGN